MKIISITITAKNLPSYRLTLTNKITLIQGDTGTGKSLMIRMIKEYYKGSESIKVYSNYECRPILNEINWKEDLLNAHNQVVFIDDTNKCIYDKEFMTYITKSDNIYVIMSRSNKFKLPIHILKQVGNINMLEGV